MERMDGGREERKERVVRGERDEIPRVRDEGSVKKRDMREEGFGEGTLRKEGVSNGEGSATGEGWTLPKT